MKPVAVVGVSMSIGHASFTPHQSFEGNPKLTIHGRPVIVTGNAFQPHASPDLPPHVGTVMGTSKLTLGGKKIAMLGDNLTCMSKIDIGDPTFTVT